MAEVMEMQFTEIFNAQLKHFQKKVKHTTASDRISKLKKIKRPSTSN